MSSILREVCQVSISSTLLWGQHCVLHPARTPPFDPARRPQYCVLTSRWSHHCALHPARTPPLTLQGGHSTVSSHLEDPIIVSSTLLGHHLWPCKEATVLRPSFVKGPIVVSFTLLVLGHHLWPSKEATSRGSHHCFLHPVRKPLLCHLLCLKATFVSSALPLFCPLSC
jgi:hypothetical protein